MPKLEYGEYRALLDIVARYAKVYEREPEKAAGFFTAGDMTAEELDARIKSNRDQSGCGTLCSERECFCDFFVEGEHIEVTLDE